MGELREDFGRGGVPADDPAIAGGTEEKLGVVGAPGRGEDAALVAYELTLGGVAFSEVPGLEDWG